RGVARMLEMATRRALGATNARIVRQLLSESLVLAAAAGIVGVVIGYFALDQLKSILPPAFSALQSVRLDARVLAAVGAISVLTSFVFGLFPAAQAARVDIRSAQSG